jgi:hypothetical protein
MGSHQNPQFYDEEKLAALESAHKDVCRILFEHYRSLPKEVVRRQLAHYLMTLAEQGVTNPAELRSRAIAHVKDAQSPSNQRNHKAAAK